MPVQKAEALFDFQPTAEVELNMKKGDVVMVRRMSVGEGWWEGELRGKRGLFPSSYVKLLAIAESAPTPPRTPPLQSTKSAFIPTKAPLTPRISKKAFMESLLTPAPSTLDHVYDPEKVAELFVSGHTDIAITLGPRWDCLPPSLTITVKDPQTETKFSGIKQYTVYDVETRELGSCVSRKYKQFLWLYDRLAELFPCISLPPLPVKQFSGSTEPDVLETRRRGLERFLNKMAKHPLLGSAKLLHDFLTAKDDKDWKIGRHVSRTSKSSKKLFTAPVYSTVKYPPYNVPLHQLASIEKFERFSRLLEMNVNTIQLSYQQLSMAHGDVMSCVDLLGRDWQRFAKGMQPTTGVQRRKLAETKSSVGAVANGQSSFYASAPHTQRTVAEREEEESGDDNEGIQWNWREDNRFNAMIRDLHDVATGMRRTGTVYESHHDSMQQLVVDTLKEYSGIIHTLPILVRLHEEAMEVYNTSKEKDSKKDAETVRQNCETLNNVLLAEFDYFSNMVVEDFQAMMINFLKQQADFHRQVADEWDKLHASYVERTSRQKNQPNSRHSSPFLTKRDTQSTTSSEGSCGPSTVPLGKDHETIGGQIRQPPPPPPPTSPPPPSNPPPPTAPPPPAIRPPPNMYVNFTVLAQKESPDEDRLGGKSWDGTVTTASSGKTDDNQYEVPFGPMRRSKSQEILPVQVGEDPLYENWQFSEASSPSKVPLPSGGNGVPGKKPMPLQRKTFGSGEAPGKHPSESKAAAKSVLKKPNPPPKPKALEQSMSQRTFSPPHYSQVSGASPHSRPVSDMPVTSRLAELTRLSNEQADAAAAATNSQQQLPLERKPRSHTTSDMSTPPERKQPLFPPLPKPSQGHGGPRLPSPSRLAARPHETIPEGVERSDSVQSTKEEKGISLLQNSWEHKAQMGLRTAGNIAPKDVQPPTPMTGAATSAGRESELMRKLSKRRQKLEQQLVTRRQPSQSPPHATECSSECSSTSSSHSELLVSYSEKRTEEPAPGSRGGGEEGEAPAVTRRNQVQQEESNNLAKYGIIEDVAGGSYVI